jgi:hypothetical protein
MVGWSCHPCADSIVAYLHGASLDDVPDRSAVHTAATFALGMARIIGQPDIIASVTELRRPED